jgi:predicted nucleic acid-binding protein
MRRAIVDTGPLVAFLDRAEQHHPWVVEQIDQLQPPLLVCEPVLAEAMHLLARFPRGRDALFGLLENGALRVAFVSMSTFLLYVSCIRNIETGQCRSPMHALYGWPKSTTSMPC